MGVGGSFLGHFDPKWVGGHFFNSNWDFQQFGGKKCIFYVKNVKIPPKMDFGPKKWFLSAFTVKNGQKKWFLSVFTVKIEPKCHWTPKMGVIL
jgi:hypothetical protein